MSGSSVLRTALVASGALAATALGVATAYGQNASPNAPLDSVNFVDPAAALQADAAAGVNLVLREEQAPRFTMPEHVEADADARGLELELAAGGGRSPLDVSIAQRASLGADGNGDLNRRGSGSELRVGQGLVERRESNQGRSVYMFVASEDEALTWQPGVRSDFGGQGASLSLQDRVDVGDLSAGVTYERGGMQASLAYVEREVSARVGRQSFSRDENFAGVTLTMRR